MPSTFYTAKLMLVISFVYYLLYTLENSDPQIGVWGNAIEFFDVGLVLFDNFTD